MTTNRIINLALDSLAKAGIYASIFAICLFMFLFFSLVKEVSIGTPPEIEHIAAYIGLFTFDLLGTWFSGNIIIKIVLFWYSVFFVLIFMFMFLKKIFPLKRNGVDGNINNVKCPRSFTFLSLFFAYSSFAAIVSGLYLSTVYGSASMILVLFYGLSAMAVAIGLWLFQTWALHATIVYSILTLLRLFNYQYGLNGKYTDSLYYFIPVIIIVSALLMLMLYYVKKKLREAGK